MSRHKRDGHSFQASLGKTAGVERNVLDTHPLWKYSFEKKQNEQMSSDLQNEKHWSSDLLSFILTHHKTTRLFSLAEVAATRLFLSFTTPGPPG